MQRRSVRPLEPLILSLSLSLVPGPLAASAVPTSCLASVMRSATLTTTKFPNVVAAVLPAFVSFTAVPFVLYARERSGKVRVGIRRDGYTKEIVHRYYRSGPDTRAFHGGAAFADFSAKRLDFSHGGLHPHNNPWKRS